MAVEIIIKGNPETNEYQDALDLKKKFETQISSNINGKIIIISGVTIFGQEVKDIDLVVIGNLNNYKLDLKSRTKENPEVKKKEVFINNFCFCIETKRNNPRDILLEGNTLLVKYSDKKSDVTSQSEKQKYSLYNFLKVALGNSPYICNFIWLRNLQRQNLNDLLNSNEYLKTNHNFLPSELNLNWLFQLACIQHFPTHHNNNQAKFNSFKKDFLEDTSKIENAFDLFEKNKSAKGEITRKKMEMISQKLLRNQLYAQEVGDKLIEISGKAGTGKTVKLLRLAFDIAVNRNKRCLILTYNHALVSDIKRLLAFLEIPDGVDSYTVRISTLHKFFYTLLEGFNLSTMNFLNNYDLNIKELYDFISNGLIEQSDIQNLMKTKHEEVAWDFIMVDESQDWSENEKNILYKIFGYQKIILTNGYDQLIRRQKKCNWIPGTEHRTIPGYKSLRQQKNLVTFINSYARKFDLDWNLNSSDELTGGRVIITTKNIDDKIYNQEKSKLLENKNSAYDMLFLVPPSLVYRFNQGNKEERKFKLTEPFSNIGIKLWDGTSKDIRTEYSVNLDEHRVLQYESCRGLEGWTVVCLELDEFINYKLNTFDESIVEDDLRLETVDQRKNRFAYIWSLIPLTRAIDTIIITLKNKNSEFAKKLHEVYIENKDFVEWID